MAATAAVAVMAGVVLVYFRQERQTRAPDTINPGAWLAVALTALKNELLRLGMARQVRPDDPLPLGNHRGMGQPALAQRLAGQFRHQRGKRPGRAAPALRFLLLLFTVTHIALIHLASWRLPPQHIVNADAVEQADIRGNRTGAPGLV